MNLLFPAFAKLLPNSLHSVDDGAADEKHRTDEEEHERICVSHDIGQGRENRKYSERADDTAENDQEGAHVGLPVVCLPARVHLRRAVDA